MPFSHLSPIPSHPVEADFDCSNSDIRALFAVAGDFDGDGRDEIAIAPSRRGTEGNDFWVMKFDPVAILWRHMSPILGHPFDADFDCSVADVSAVFAVVGDFDGDGRDKIAIAPFQRGTAGNDFWVMKFDPRAGQWQHMSPIPGHPFDADFDCSVADVSAVFAVVGDFDGDGRDKIAIAPFQRGTAGNDFWVMKFDPRAGQWQHMSPIPGHPFDADFDCSVADISARGFVAGDFDGDGRDEIAISVDARRTAGNDFWVMKFDPRAGQWQHMSPIPGHPFDADFDCSVADVDSLFVVAGDFDGDGRDKITIAPNQPGTVGNDFWVMKFDPRAGQWQHMSPIPGHPFDADFDCSVADIRAILPAVVGDFDGDNRAEIAIAPEDWLAGFSNNDFWVMKFLDGWRHMSPIPGHVFDADFDCTVLDVSASKIAAVGDFDGDEMDKIALTPEVIGSGGNDFWVMDFSFADPLDTVLSGTGRLDTTHPSAPGPFFAPVTVSIQLSPNRLSGRIIAMSPIVNSFPTPVGNNTATITLRRAGPVAVRRSTGFMSVDIDIFLRNTIFLFGDSSLTLPMSTSGSFPSLGLFGSPINQVTGAVTMVGSGLFSGGALDGQTGILTISGTLSAVP